MESARRQRVHEEGGEGREERGEDEELILEEVPGLGAVLVFSEVREEIIVVIDC